MCMIGVSRVLARNDISSARRAAPAHPRSVTNHDRPRELVAESLAAVAEDEDPIDRAEDHQQQIPDDRLAEAARCAGPHRDA